MRRQVVAGRLTARLNLNFKAAPVGKQGRSRARRRAAQQEITRLRHSHRCDREEWVKNLSIVPRTTQKEMHWPQPKSVVRKIHARTMRY